MSKKIEVIQPQEKIEKMGTFYERVTRANIDFFHYWKSEIFLHWDFWLPLGFTIIPLIIWIKIHKKASRGRLLFAGFFVLIITCWFDFLGVAFGLWYYTGKVIPTLPSYAPWDFVLFPVLAMLIIQFKPHFPAWKKGLFFASVATFIGEPLFWLLGFYILTKWNILYSFPIYFLIYLAADRLSKITSFEKL